MASKQLPANSRLEIFMVPPPPYFTSLFVCLRIISLDGVFLMGDHIEAFPLSQLLPDLFRRGGIRRKLEETAEFARSRGEISLARKDRTEQMMQGRIAAGGFAFERVASRSFSELHFAEVVIGYGVDIVSLRVVRVHLREAAGYVAGGIPPAGPHVKGCQLHVRPRVFGVRSQRLLEGFAGALLVFQSQTAFTQHAPSGGKLRVNLDGLFQLFGGLGRLWVFLLQQLLRFFPRFFSVFGSFQGSN